MPGSHLFNLGLFQKNFGGNNRIAGVSINLGSTKGRGSSTRMFNYCKTHSANPSECIDQFINIAPLPNISVSYTGASSFNSNPYTGTSNGYTYLKFTNSGTINMISESGTIYYVIVGGGGDCNVRENSVDGGGGGGGQVLSGSVNLTQGTYNITVGSSGQSSSFYTLTASNGLSPPGPASSPNSGNGGNSGSGGLGGLASYDAPGNPGVNGGGGSGGYGANPGGNGGDGPLINFADGSSGIYFGGGGGGGYSGGGGDAISSSGGAGGGGIGGGLEIATSGSANTGGGGGAGAWNGASKTGGSGASGVVLLYYI
jgi:hypothetical protein